MNCAKSSGTSERISSIILAYPVNILCVCSIFDTPKTIWLCDSVNSENVLIKNNKFLKNNYGLGGSPGDITILSFGKNNNLNLNQVCNILAKSKRTINRYIKKGLLNPERARSEK